METIKSGRMTYSKYKPIEVVSIFVSGVLWLCLVLMPWFLLTVLSHITGIVELSSLELKTTIFVLLGSVIQIILYSQE